MSQHNVGTVVRVTRHPHSEAVGRAFHLDGDRVWRETTGNGLFYRDSQLDTYADLVDFSVETVGAGDATIPGDDVVERKALRGGEIQVGQQIEFVESLYGPMRGNMVRAVVVSVVGRSYGALIRVDREDKVTGGGPNGEWNISVDSRGVSEEHGQIYSAGTAPLSASDSVDISRTIVLARVERDAAELAAKFDAFVADAVSNIDELRALFTVQLNAARRDLSS